MSENFLKAAERTLKLEGAYSNDPHDPGGETMWGITIKTARRWGYVGEMRFLPRETALEIYKAEYWDPIHGDEIPFVLAYQLFDTAINSGPGQATKLLQRSLGIEDDGVFGPQTLSAAQAVSPLTGSKVFDLIQTRSDFQQRLPTWPAFSRGWTNRNLQNAKYAYIDLFEAFGGGV